MSEAPITVRVFRSAEAVAQHAAEAVLAAADNALRRQHELLLCLAGGRTPRLLYQLLASEPFADRVPWRATRVFFGDERCVPPGDSASNYGMARQALLARVALPDDRVERIRGELEPQRAAAEYETRLRARLSVGASGAPARGFDLALLGMGDDGHTASLFPHSVDEPEHWVSARTDREHASARVSLLPQVFNAARAVCFLVTGAHKAQRVAEVLAGPQRPDALPAQRIEPVDGTLTWLLDHAAASALLERRLQPEQLQQREQSEQRERQAQPGAAGRLRVEVEP